MPSLEEKGDNLLITAEQEIKQKTKQGKTQKTKNRTNRMKINYKK